MNKTMVFALSALVAGGVVAREADRERPADPEVRVPPAEYRSAFEDYRPFKEQEVAPWREVNDEVARVGGHMGVLKDGPSSEGRSSLKGQEPPTPHRGHGGAR